GCAVAALRAPVTGGSWESHPGGVLRPSRLLRHPRIHVAAPPTVRKRSQTPTTEPAPFAPGAGAPTIQTPAPAPVSCRSTAHGAKAEPNPNHRARPLRTRGAYRPGSCAGSRLCRSTALGAKAESNHNPRARPHSHPGRVLLPSRLLRQPRFPVGAPPTVRKRSQTTTPE